MMKRITELKDAYAGRTAIIVGRGPSLLHVRKSHFKGKGPVIVLSEAIINVARLGLSNDVFTMWRNADCLPDLADYKAKMILCDDAVHPDAPSAALFLDYEDRYVFDCRSELGQLPNDQFGHKAAIEIAVRIFGCTRIKFIGFDACTTGDCSVVLDNVLMTSENEGSFPERCRIVDKRLEQLDIKTAWTTPKPPAKRRPRKKKEKPAKKEDKPEEETGAGEKDDNGNNGDG